MQPQIEFQAEGALSPLPYENRLEAARVLARSLSKYAQQDVIVLALPRGGVPVGYEVARALGAPLDLMIVRKLGFPGQEELAIGAIASGGAKVLNSQVADLVDARFLEVIEARERQELERRDRLYRGSRAQPVLRGRTVILVDDGLATGATMRAAIAAVRTKQPARVVVAVPVAPVDTIHTLRREADAVICPATPEPFYAIGLWYRDFQQVSDDTVRELLARAWHGESEDPPADAPDVPRRMAERQVRVDAAGAELAGTLRWSEPVTGLVIFAHGSGSSRLSARNRYVANELNEAGQATLLFDLLTSNEERIDEQTRELRFNIPFLTERLVGAIDWARDQSPVAAAKIGLFGASTGAAAALAAAAERPDVVRAVVSRGGRPDLAGESLGSVQAPTLLIVGGRDTQVLELNREAAAKLRAPHRLVVVPAATHLFEEPGALTHVAHLACSWFEEHLS
jgi:putative phosphoribosyl transferase